MTQPFAPADLLRRLGERYRHVEQEHRREPPSRAALRHRLGERMRDLAARFERVLGRWTTDEALRARWREFLRGRGPAPDEPRLAPPPLFKGHTEAGALVELRPAAGGYDIFVDGARSDHTGVPWHLDPDSRGPVLIGAHTCDETFDAAPEAIAALSELLAGRGEPPWRWARELFEDGLAEAALLPERGRRAPLKPAPGRPVEEERTRRYGRGSS